jgi:hypothetical protein
VVYEDDESFWTPASGGSGGIDISVAQETVTVHSGFNSLKYQVVAGTKAWVTIYHGYASAQDWSGYDALAIWWYGQNTGAVLDVHVSGPDWSNRLSSSFVDDFTGWGKVALPVGGFASTGSPSWSAVRGIQIATAASTPSMWYLDTTTMELATRSLTVNTVGSGSVAKIPDSA